VGFSLPNGAAAAIDRYLDAADAAVPGLVVGLHVVGSLALGDYAPERSDIDVVVIVDIEPDAAQRSHFAEIHRVVATRIDGPYLTPAQLALLPAEIGPVPFHVDGHFRIGECHEVSPITWAILADDAITVRGDAPAVTRDDAAVRAFSAANLAEYWASWARTIEALIAETADDERIEARMLEWGVLGAARVHCAAHTGRVVSKSVAGDYALEQFDGVWHDVITRALKARAGTLDEVRVGDLRAACAFVQLLVQAG
jgi:hypothetical protein